MENVEFRNNGKLVTGCYVLVNPHLANPVLHVVYQNVAISGLAIPKDAIGID